MEISDEDKDKLEKSITRLVSQVEERDLVLKEGSAREESLRQEIEAIFEAIQPDIPWEIGDYLTDGESVVRVREVHAAPALVLDSIAPRKQDGAFMRAYDDLRRNGFRKMSSEE